MFMYRFDRPAEPPSEGVFGMLTSTLTRPRPAVESSLTRAPQSSRTSRPLPFMVGGAWLVTTAIAASALARPVEHRGPVPHEVAAPVEAQNPSAMTLRGPNDVTVVNQVYEPGQSSDWHRHTGIHAVAVLSGALTFYDRECHAQLVVPGRPYVGGQDLHLARNETSAPVEMVVTYLSPAVPGNSTVRVAAPPCALGGANG